MSVIHSPVIFLKGADQLVLLSCWVATRGHTQHSGVLCNSLRSWKLSERANVKVHSTMPHCCSKEKLATLPCNQHELKNYVFKVPEPINTFRRAICHWWVFDYGVIKGNGPQLYVAVSVCGEIRTSTVGEEFAPPQSEVSLHESERKPVCFGIFFQVCLLSLSSPVKMMMCNFLKRSLREVYIVKKTLILLNVDRAYLKQDERIIYAFCWCMVECRQAHLLKYCTDFRYLLQLANWLRPPCS